MKKRIVIAVTLLLTLTTTYAKEFTARVTISNETDIPFSKGTLYIDALHYKHEFTTTGEFMLTIPDNGKYVIRFESENFICTTLYPVRLNKRNAQIQVKLTETLNIANQIPLNTTLIHKRLTIAEQIEAGQSVNFVINGITPIPPQTYALFKEKYGIGIVTENCAVDPISFRNAKLHNQAIANYLTEKFGTEWKEDLPISILGISNE